MLATDIKIWLSSFFITCLVYAGLLSQWQSTGFNMQVKQQVSPVISRLTFSLRSAEAIPEKIKQPEIRKSEERPVSKPVPQKRTKPVKSAKQLTVADTSQLKPEETVAELSKQGVDNTHKLVAASEAIIEKANNNYMEKLLSHIEQFKYYPGAARRRGIEGKVNIRISISPSGEIVTVETTGQYKLLNQAARGAIETASPLPSLPARHTVPLDIEFTIEYTLSG